MNMTGNTILITGGGTGIGRALAAAFQKLGNTVVITGRRRSPLEETCAANPGMRWATLDVADADAIKAFAAKIVIEHPALNVVIHNAGIMVAEEITAEAMEIEVPEATIATNLLGPIRLTAALLPHLGRQDRASVVTVSSGLAFVPLAMTPTYCATKAAIHSWSQSLRHQLRDTTIAVIEIVPPAVATDLMPGHAQNSRSMPLAAFIAETMDLLKAHPVGPEIGVDNVRMLRDAEASGQYAAVFGMLNAAH